MPSVSKARPMRLLAAVMALALAVSCVVGAYAHATGHALPSAQHGTAVADAGEHAGHHGPVHETGAPKPGDAGVTHDCDGTGHSPLDCCDTICHGGQAILAASVPVSHPTLYAPLIHPADAFDGADPGGLDRPPKPFRSA